MKYFFSSISSIAIGIYALTGEAMWLTAAAGSAFAAIDTMLEEHSNRRPL